MIGEDNLEAAQGLVDSELRSDYQAYEAIVRALLDCARSLRGIESALTRRGVPL